MSSLARPLKWPPVFPLEKGLVLWLPFDDRSGSKAYDRSGKGNHGTLYGPTWVAGRRGSALSFDGVNDYVSVPDSSSLDIVDYVTMVAWVKPLFACVAADPYVMGKGEDCYTMYLNKAARTVRFGFRRGLDNAFAQVVGSTSLITGTWNFLVGLYDGINMKVYVNGVLDGSEARAGETIKTDNLALKIAIFRTAYFLDCIIGEVRVYNRALNAAEVKRLYESELLLARH